MSHNRYAGKTVAFVGCGRISHLHADVLKYLGVQICAVCGRLGSTRAKLFAEQHSVARVYEDFRALLAAERPDAFWVVASWDQVEKFLLPLIQTGIPCFFEKPVALHVDALQDAIKEQKLRGTTVAVGYNRRFYDFISRLEAIISGHGVDAVDVHIPEQTEFVSQPGSQSLIAYLWHYSSSHVVDLLMYLLGDIDIIHVSRGGEESGAPRSCHGLLRVVQYNAPIHINAHWNAPENHTLTFYCGPMRVVLSPMEMMRIYKGMKLVETASAASVRSFEPILLEEHSVDGTFKPGFLAQAVDFFSTKVLNESDLSQACTLEEALRVFHLCEEMSGFRETTVDR